MTRQAAPPVRVLEQSVLGLKFAVSGKPRSQSYANMFLVLVYFIRLMLLCDKSGFTPFAENWQELFCGPRTNKKSRNL
jgi:hypothetical protein